jgi:hypothetical protein
MDLNDEEDEALFFECFFQPKSAQNDDNFEF